MTCNEIYEYILKDSFFSNSGFEISDYNEDGHLIRCLHSRLESKKGLVVTVFYKCYLDNPSSIILDMCLEDTNVSINALKLICETFLDEYNINRKHIMVYEFDTNDRGIEVEFVDMDNPHFMKLSLGFFLERFRQINMFIL